MDVGGFVITGSPSQNEIAFCPVIPCDDNEVGPFFREKEIQFFALLEGNSLSPIWNEKEAMVSSKLAMIAGSAVSPR
jgi:hypothetical protein